MAASLAADAAAAIKAARDLALDGRYEDALGYYEGAVQLVAQYACRPKPAVERRRSLTRACPLVPAAARLQDAAGAGPHRRSGARTMAGHAAAAAG